MKREQLQSGKNKRPVRCAAILTAAVMLFLLRVLLLEAKPSLITGAAIALTTILGYSAMAGIVGGGGLGAFAINYGYYRYKYLVMLLAVILLIIIVQVFQSVGTRLSVKLDKRLKQNH